MVSEAGWRLLDFFLLPGQWSVVQILWVHVYVHWLICLLRKEGVEMMLSGMLNFDITVKMIMVKSEAAPGHTSVKFLLFVFPSKAF